MAGLRCSQPDDFPWSAASGLACEFLRVGCCTFTPPLARTQMPPRELTVAHCSMGQHGSVRPQLPPSLAHCTAERGGDHGNTGARDGLCARERLRSIPVDLHASNRTGRAKRALASVMLTAA